MFIMPTMNRPKQAADVLDSIASCYAQPPGMIWVNGYQHLDEYEQEIGIKRRLPKNWHFTASSYNLGCIGVLNEVFKRYPNEPWYGFWADDEYLLPESPHDWSDRLIEAAGSWNIAHAYENWNQGNRAQGAVIIGGKLARAIGYLGVKECWHNFGFDCMLEWLSGPYEVFGGGNCCKLICVPEVKIRHLRAEGKTDDCYKLAESTFEKDREAFWKWRVNEMPKVVERVKAARDSA